MVLHSDAEARIGGALATQPQRDVDGVNPGAGRVRMALVAPLAECVEAAERIRDFNQRRH